MTTTSHLYEDVVDLNRYPINDPSGPACRTWSRPARSSSATGGSPSSPGSSPRPPSARCSRWPPGWPLGVGERPDAHRLLRAPRRFRGPGHPRALLQHSAKKAIAFDQIPADAPIRRLYESDDLTALLAAVLGKRVLYRSADPLDALEIAIFADGDELGWHFDNSEFSVTVMYRNPTRAATSTTVPGCGRERPELSGCPGDPARRRGRRTRLPSGPGTLAVFRGQHALHRVTPVSGPRPRINSVLTYGEHPGMKLSELTQKLFYGRTA